jgi:hypothetical protein
MEGQEELRRFGKLLNEVMAKVDLSEDELATELSGARPLRTSGTVAEKSGYLLCASPRSGSTMLCDLLGRTRRAGLPESLFRGPDIAQYADEWGVVAPDGQWDRSYLDAARKHGSADSGCFAMRIMWSDMPPFLERLAGCLLLSGSRNMCTYQGRTRLLRRFRWS